MLVIFGGNMDMNVLRPSKLNTLLLNGCIRCKWKLNNLNQVYPQEITQFIVKHFQDSVDLTVSELDALKVGDNIDFRDNNGKYGLCKISEKNGTNLKLESNWSNSTFHQINQWCDYSIKNQQIKCAKPNAISGRSTKGRFDNTLEIGSKMFVNPSRTYGNWKLGTLTKYINSDGKSCGYRTVESTATQIQIEYEVNNMKYVWWAHLDDHEEVERFIDQRKEWQIVFDTKPNSIQYGPFNVGQMTFLYAQRKYNMFANGLSQCNGKIKIKRIDDKEWSHTDEVGLHLLMINLTHEASLLINDNELNMYLQTLYTENEGLWLYRYGSFGDVVHGPKKIDAMDKKPCSNYYSTNWNDDTIFIKRVGEIGWYKTNGIDVQILFNHLNIHKNNINVPMGMKYIKQRIEVAHNQVLPYIEYNEWNIIHLLMKAMNVDQYFNELKTFCNEQDFEDIECIMDDLESFITEGYDGSLIMEYFKKIYVDDHDDDDDDIKLNNGSENEWIKLGFIVYHSMTLLPIFKQWTDIFHAQYLEKWFSYAQCDHTSEICPIIIRLYPLIHYLHLFNKDISYIPGQINNRSPYWITQSAFLSVLPHYDKIKLVTDCQHLKKMTRYYGQLTDYGNTQVYFSDDDTDHDTDESDMEKIDETKVKNCAVFLSKIFTFFDTKVSNIKCQIQDCHSMNRECFPARSFPPWPYPYGYMRHEQKTKDETNVIYHLDLLHNLVQHTNFNDTKYKCLKHINKNELNKMKQFMKKRRAANRHYFKTPIDKAPEFYYWEDNKVGWDAVKNIK